MLDILSSAGLGVFLGHTYTVVISSIGVAMTLVGMAFVDKLGRKPLLVWGSAGMAVCLFCLALAIPHHLGPPFICRFWLPTMSSSRFLKERSFGFILVSCFRRERVEQGRDMVPR